jgi:DNA-binding HxlR family transcriptional regulator
MQENGEVASASKEQTRAGSKALALLADPLTARVLRAHLDRPLRFSDLEATLGWAPVTTLRAAVNSLRCVGALKRSTLRQMPYRVENELADAGRDLILVADALERWLARSPMGPIGTDTVAAKGVVRALTAGWDCGAVRVLAERPASLTELSAALAGVSYHSLSRRLGKMRATGQVEAVDGCSKGVSYAATNWLRQAIAPLTAAGYWERMHIPDAAPSVDRREVEAAFLLTLPLVDLPDQLSGECSLAVITPGAEADGQSTEVAGVSVRAEPSGIVLRPADIAADPHTVALGPVEAWFEAIISGDHASLRLSGTEPHLPRSIVAALHASLFAPSS